MGQICQRKKNATAGTRKSQLPNASPTLELVRRPLGVAVAMSLPPKKKTVHKRNAETEVRRKNLRYRKVRNLRDREPDARASGSPSVDDQLKYRYLLGVLCLD